jgi:threonine aldolase
MIQYSFQNDYSEGAHPRILEALTKTNFDQQPGYGEDRYCLDAAHLIRRVSASPDADVHFVSGGTQANLILLSSCLRSYESVIAVDSGHILVHETGSIEATGHKIHGVKGQNGKVTVAEIENVVSLHGTDEHMVHPRIVYISHSTEIGTIYSAKELKDISATCKKLNLYLYLDGARLGSALTSTSADLDMKELSSLVDAFYIGGTKNGALLGDFRYFIKQRGGLLSKGRVLGIQFLELFKDDLFFDLARHANTMASKLAAGISALGYGFQSDSPTNQIFPIFPNAVIRKLNESYHFYVWNKIDSDHSAVRLVTSWATPEKAIDGFLAELKTK